MCQIGWIRLSISFPIICSCMFWNIILKSYFHQIFARLYKPVSYASFQNTFLYISNWFPRDPMGSNLAALFASVSITNAFPNERGGISCCRGLLGLDWNNCFSISINRGRSDMDQEGFRSAHDLGNSICIWFLVRTNSRAEFNTF